MLTVISYAECKSVCSQTQASGTGTENLCGGRDWEEERKREGALYTSYFVPRTNISRRKLTGDTRKIFVSNIRPSTSLTRRAS